MHAAKNSAHILGRNCDVIIVSFHFLQGCWKCIRASKQILEMYVKQKWQVVNFLLTFWPCGHWSFFCFEQSGHNIFFNFLQIALDISRQATQVALKSRWACFPLYLCNCIYHTMPYSTKGYVMSKKRRLFHV